MKKINKLSKIDIRKYAVGVALGLSLLPLLVMAQAGTQPPSTNPVISNPNELGGILRGILNWMLGIIFVVALIMIFYAAILYLTAGASEAAHSKAKGVLIFAIIGIAVAILGYSFRPFIEAVLGLRG